MGGSANGIPRNFCTPLIVSSTPTTVPFDIVTDACLMQVQSRPKESMKIMKGKIHAMLPSSRSPHVVNGRSSAS